MVLYDPREDTTVSYNIQMLESLDNDISRSVSKDQCQRQFNSFQKFMAHSYPSSVNFAPHAFKAYQAMSLAFSTPSLLSSSPHSPFSAETCNISSWRDKDDTNNMLVGYSRHMTPEKNDDPTLSKRPKSTSTVNADPVENILQDLDELKKRVKAIEVLLSQHS
jgi:hypothetical protein